MAKSTIIEIGRGGLPTVSRVSRVRRRMPGWLWFVALWCGGVGAAMLTGFAFKVLMNATLFAVVR